VKAPGERLDDLAEVASLVAEKDGARALNANPGTGNPDEIKFTMKILLQSNLAPRNRYEPSCSGSLLLSMFRC